MPWELPDGIEDYIGSIKTNFLCSKEGGFLTKHSHRKVVKLSI